MPLSHHTHFHTLMLMQDVTFLYKFAPGVAASSFGINVARLAGVPGPVIGRAKALAGRFQQVLTDGSRTALMGEVARCVALAIRQQSSSATPQLGSLWRQLHSLQAQTRALLSSKPS